MLLNPFNEHDLAGAERLVKSLDPTGLYFAIANYPSKGEAEDLIEKITRWCE